MISIGYIHLVVF